ncbi:hypothetical protein SGO26_30230 (plasmid) [Cupriavidus metallidurans]|uniref:hypothetical protein n=1 Tax=Cupriavidus metallidurans TaxID=119219 RepID=UPI003D72C5EE
MNISLSRFKGVAAPIYLVVPAVALLLLTASAVVFAFSMLQLRNSNHGKDFWRDQVPTISASTTPLTEELYKSIVSEAVRRPNVTIEARTDRIVIRGTALSDLQGWKDAVTDLMILHPELSVRNVCAGASVCQGAALVAELSGTRREISVGQ